MGDMVFAPAFDELDAEREVVLEEIAMYEDTPQELVHDLISEAVFGDHALGRPVIGTAEVISSMQRRRDRALPRDDVHAGEHRRRGRRQRRPRASCSSSLEQALGRRGRGSRRGAERAAAARPGAAAADCGSSARTPSSTTCASARPASRAPTGAASPSSLLDAILGGSASSRLFQEIREKRGLAYAVYSFVSQYTDTGQIGIYVGTREDNLAEALAIAADQIADIASGNLPERELTRAKENLKGRILLSMESTSTRMNRLGKSLITDSELLSLDRLVAEVDAVEAESVCALAAALLAPEQLSAAGIGPDEDRFLAALEPITPSLAAPHEDPPQRAGRQGRFRARPGARAGRPRAGGRRLRDADAMIDFTAPDAVVANVLAAICGRRCAGGRRNVRLGRRRGRRSGPCSAASPSSTPRTSRSARC